MLAAMQRGVDQDRQSVQLDFVLKNDDTKTTVFHLRLPRREPVACAHPLTQTRNRRYSSPRHSSTSNPASPRGIGNPMASRRFDPVKIGLSCHCNCRRANRMQTARLESRPISASNRVRGHEIDCELCDSASHYPRQSESRRSMSHDALDFENDIGTRSIFLKCQTMTRHR
jgi:hypothetical protein